MLARIVLSCALALVIVPGCAADEESETSESPTMPERADPPAGAATAVVDAERELLVRDPSVVDDPIRTKNDGAWTFGRVSSRDHRSVAEGLLVRAAPARARRSARSRSKRTCVPRIARRSTGGRSSGTCSAPSRSGPRRTTRRCNGSQTRCFSRIEAFACARARRSKERARCGTSSSTKPAARS